MGSTEVFSFTRLQSVLHIAAFLWLVVVGWLVRRGWRIGWNRVKYFRYWVLGTAAVHKQAVESAGGPAGRVGGGAGGSSAAGVRRGGRGVDEEEQGGGGVTVTNAGVETPAAYRVRVWIVIAVIVLLLFNSAGLLIRCEVATMTDSVEESGKEDGFCHSAFYVVGMGFQLAGWIWTGVIVFTWRFHKDDALTRDLVAVCGFSLLTLLATGVLCARRSLSTTYSLLVFVRFALVAVTTLDATERILTGDQDVFRWCACNCCSDKQEGEMTSGRAGRRTHHHASPDEREEALLRSFDSITSSLLNPILPYGSESEDGSARRYARHTDHDGLSSESAGGDGSEHPHDVSSYSAPAFGPDSANGAEPADLDDLLVAKHSFANDELRHSAGKWWSNDMTGGSTPTSSPRDLRGRDGDGDDAARARGARSPNPRQYATSPPPGVTPPALTSQLQAMSPATAAAAGGGGSGGGGGNSASGVDLAAGADPTKGRNSSGPAKGAAHAFDVSTSSTFGSSRWKLREARVVRDLQESTAVDVLEGAASHRQGTKDSTVLYLFRFTIPVACISPNVALPPVRDNDSRPVVRLRPSNALSSSEQEVGSDPASPPLPAIWRQCQAYLEPDGQHVVLHVRKRGNELILLTTVLAAQFPTIDLPMPPRIAVVGPPPQGPKAGNSISTSADAAPSSSSSSSASGHRAQNEIISSAQQEIILQRHAKTPSDDMSSNPAFDAAVVEWSVDDRHNESVAEFVQCLLAHPALVVTALSTLIPRLPLRGFGRLLPPSSGGAAGAAQASQHRSGRNRAHRHAETRHGPDGASDSDDDAEEDDADGELPASIKHRGDSAAATHGDGYGGVPTGSRDPATRSLPEKWKHPVARLCSCLPSTPLLPSRAVVEVLPAGFEGTFADEPLLLQLSMRRPAWLSATGDPRADGANRAQVKRAEREKRKRERKRTREHRAGRSDRGSSGDERVDADKANEDTAELESGGHSSGMEQASFRVEVSGWKGLTRLPDGSGKLAMERWHCGRGRGRHGAMLLQRWCSAIPASASPPPSSPATPASASGPEGGLRHSRGSLIRHLDVSCSDSGRGSISTTSAGRGEEDVDDSDRPCEARTGNSATSRASARFSGSARRSMAGRKGSAVDGEPNHWYKTGELPDESVRRHIGVDSMQRWPWSHVAGAAKLMRDTVIYEIEIQLGGAVWRLRKLYRHFRALHHALESLPLHEDQDKWKELTSFVRLSSSTSASTSVQSWNLPQQAPARGGKAGPPSSANSDGLRTTDATSPAHAPGAVPGVAGSRGDDGTDDGDNQDALALPPLPADSFGHTRFPSSYPDMRDAARSNVLRLQVYLQQVLRCFIRVVAVPVSESKSTAAQSAASTGGHEHNNESARYGIAGDLSDDGGGGGDRFYGASDNDDDNDDELSLATAKSSPARLQKAKSKSKPKRGSWLASLSRSSRSLVKAVTRTGDTGAAAEQEGDESAMARQRERLGQLPEDENTVLEWQSVLCLPPCLQLFLESGVVWPPERVPLLSSDSVAQIGPSAASTRCRDLVLSHAVSDPHSGLVWTDTSVLDEQLRAAQALPRMTSASSAYADMLLTVQRNHPWMSKAVALHPVPQAGSPYPRGRKRPQNQERQTPPAGDMSGFDGLVLPLDVEALQTVRQALHETGRQIEDRDGFASAPPLQLNANLWKGAGQAEDLVRKPRQSPALPDSNGAGRDGRSSAGLFGHVSNSMLPSPSFHSFSSQMQEDPLLLSVVLVETVQELLAQVHLLAGTCPESSVSLDARTAETLTSGLHSSGRTDLPGRGNQRAGREAPVAAMERISEAERESGQDDDSFNVRDSHVSLSDALLGEGRDSGGRDGIGGGGLVRGGGASSSSSNKRLLMHASAEQSAFGSHAFYSTEDLAFAPDLLTSTSLLSRALSPRAGAQQGRLMPLAPELEHDGGLSTSAAESPRPGVQIASDDQGASCSTAVSEAFGEAVDLASSEAGLALWLHQLERQSFKKERMGHHANGLRLRQLLVSTSAWTQFQDLTNRLATIDLDLLRPPLPTAAANHRRSIEEPRAWQSREKGFGAVEGAVALEQYNVEHHHNRLAFFINIYNALCMHAAVVCNWPEAEDHHARVPFLFQVRYEIGGQLLSLGEIEFLILRAAAIEGEQAWFATRFLPKPFPADDPRAQLCLSRPEPLVSFALCLPTASSPALRVYTPDGIIEQLTDATAEYLRTHITIEFDRADGALDEEERASGSSSDVADLLLGRTHNPAATPTARGAAALGLVPRTVILPRIMYWYRRDFNSAAFGVLRGVNRGAVSVSASGGGGGGALRKSARRSARLQMDALDGSGDHPQYGLAYDLNGGDPEAMDAPDDLTDGAEDWYAAARTRRQTGLPLMAPLAEGAAVFDSMATSPATAGGGSGGGGGGSGATCHGEAAVEELLRSGQNQSSRAVAQRGVAAQSLSPSPMPLQQRQRVSPEYAIPANDDPEDDGYLCTDAQLFANADDDAAVVGVSFAVPSAGGGLAAGVQDMTNPMGAPPRGAYGHEPLDARGQEYLEDLCKRMMQGVEVADRRYHFRVYKKTFLGTEAVSWLLASGEAKTEQEAIRLGNKLVAARMIRHVVDEHWLENKELFYIFSYQGPSDAPLSEFFGFLSSHLAPEASSGRAGSTEAPGRRGQSRNTQQQRLREARRRHRERLLQHLADAVQHRCKIQFDSYDWTFAVPAVEDDDEVVDEWP